MGHHNNPFSALPGKKVLPAANSQFAIVAPDLGLIFLFITLISCTPFLVGLWYGELELLLPMASAPAGFGVLGVWLAGVPKAEEKPASPLQFLPWAGRLEIMPVIVLAAGASRRRL